MFERDKKGGGEHQAAGNSFLTLIQVIQKHGITSTVGAEAFLSSLVETHGPLPTRQNGHAD